LALWVSTRKRPFAIVSDPEYLEIVTMLQSRTDTPSPTTVSRDVKEIYSITKESVAKELHATKGKLHCGLDGWQSPN
ncbi:hypothetical protein C8J56DRAFT_722679, partial [Mycena floridula]